jgi:anti-sigma regulatory factor (Ser/Thr protein kinase)
VFPGEAAQVGMVRDWLEDLLPQCAARYDVIVVASELCANAVCHTASGRGGQFVVEITWSAELVRVRVGDGGAPTVPRIVQDPDVHGRGLQLVHGLCAGMGVSGGVNGRYVWADLPWAANGGPWPAEPGCDQVIAAELDALQGRYPAVAVWFGRVTRQCWAMAGASGRGTLICAPSPAALAARLAASAAARPGSGEHGLPLARAPG